MAPDPARTRRSLAAALLAAPFVGAIQIYRFTLAPLMGGQCRFTPSCSAYALEAFRTLPAHRAAALTLRRLLRCHPWGGSGFDPVPRECCEKDSEVRRTDGS